MSEPTPEAVEALLAISAQHRYVEVHGDYEIKPYRKYFGCTCGWEQDISGMSGYWSWRDAHDRHTACAVLAAGYVLLEPEAAVERVDKYTINIGAASITATADQERRIKEMTARQRVGLARMLGKKP